MYFLQHPISSLNFLIARVMADQITLFLSIVLFIYLSRSYKNPEWIRIDNEVINFGKTSTNKILRMGANNLAVFGNAIFHISFCIILSILFVVLKQKLSYAVSILFCLIFSWALNRLLKILFKRERPEETAEDTKKRLSYCFPSGHVMASISIYFFISILLQNTIPIIPWHIISLVLCSFIVLSRIYLNHHFFTDILGGICMGITALNISIWFYFIVGIL